MAALKDKVKDALDEVRTLVLGAQVLLAFQLTATLEGPFETFPRATQIADVVALLATGVSLAILLAPVSRHRIVERGEASQAMLAVSTAAARAALVPFAGVMGFDVFFVVERVDGTGPAIVGGVVVTLLALAFFYGIEAARKRTREHAEDLRRAKRMSEREDDGTMSLKDKIQHVLTETRVVLPGVQALLGFQFSAVLLGGFEKLPHAAKLVHVGALVAMSIGAIFLLTPAAYHRIVEGGEDTEHFHRFASSMILASLAPLALGITGDFFVVAWKVLGSIDVALVASAILLGVFATLWVAYPLVERSRRRPAERRPSGGELPSPG